MVRIEGKEYLWEKGELGDILDQDVSYESADDHLGARMEHSVHLNVLQADVQELLLRITEKGAEGVETKRKVDENMAGVFRRWCKRTPLAHFGKQRL